MVEPKKGGIRWLRFGVRLVIALALLIIALLIYLTTADLSRFKGIVERAATNATGRQLTIDGRFEPDFGRTTSIIVTDITFANPDWSAEPAMVSVDHLAVSIDLWSLISGPIVVHDFEIGGVRVALEVDGKGRSNWELDLPAEPTGDEDEPLALTLEHLEIRDVEITYRNEPDNRAITVRVDRSASEENDDGFLTLDVRGSLNDETIEIAGRVGTIDNLLADENVSLDLSGRVGALQLELQGQVAELATLKRPDVHLEIHADELAAITDMLDLDSPGEGGLHVSGRLSPVETGVTLDLQVKIADVRAALVGKVDDLIDLTVADLSIEASGPDLTLLDPFVKGLPSGAFDLSGRLQQKGESYSFDHVEARLGGNEAKVHGTLGELPEMTGASVEFEIGGPDLSVFSTLAGTQLPSRSFKALGRIDSESEGLKLDGVRAQIGRNRFALDGILGPPPKLAGSSLLIHAQGPDIRTVPGIASLANPPADAFDLEGRVTITTDHFEIGELHATVGTIDLGVEGVVGRKPDFDGSDLQIKVRGSDLDRVTPFTGLDALPTEPYSVIGLLSSHDSRYLVNELVVQVGSGRIELSGEIGTAADLVGTELQYDASVPDLAIFDVLVPSLELPDESLTSRGRVGINETGYVLETVKAQLGNASISVEGIVSREADLSGTDLVVDASAADLTLLEPFVRNYQLPAKQFSTAAHVRIKKNGYDLGEATAQLGGTTLNFEGTVGRPPKLIGTDVTFNVKGPNFAEIAAIMDRNAPAEPFSLVGRVERFQDGLRLHDVSAAVGANTMKVSGRVGEPPELVGTDLAFRAEGPNLQLIAQLAGLGADFEADEPFATTGHFSGTPDALQLRDFTTRLGESDLSGTFDLDLRGKPELKGQFSSSFLKLSQFLGKPDTSPAGEAKSAESSPVEPTPEERRLLISDSPLVLNALDRANVDVQYSAQNIELKGGRLSNVEFGLRLSDRTLVLDPISARGSRMGTVSAKISLTPLGDGFDVAVEGVATQLRLGMLTKSEEHRSQQPPIDVDFRFAGQGASLHAIAASGNGHVEIVQGSGRIDNSALSMLTNSIVMQIIDAINPFRKKEPYTAFDCGVYAVRIVDGVATLDPLLARTDKMTIVGSGQINLQTESLTLEWKTKPRKGLGISVSSITNPYIRLVGTLSEPEIGFKPEDAMLSTGVAVATGGISILASSFYDRLMADPNVCGTALEKYRGGNASK